jgi:peptidoglycan/xylan/chitin deacetylase (PgdA/CDA1 family)
MGRRRTVVLSLLLLALLVAAAVGDRGHGGAQAGPRAGLNVAGDPLLERSDPAARALRRRRARSAGRAVDRALRGRTLLRRGNRHEREIALTFDDGPSPYTRAILRILRRAHVRATFFPVGYSLDRWPRSLAAEARAGHVVGDHTLHHPPLARLSFRDQLHEIRGEARRLRHRHIPSPRLVRPPYGSYDRRTVTIARRLRMLVVMWSVDSEDYTRPGRGAIVRNVLAGARPGAIVLMHDGGGPREQTVAALPTVIRRLRRRGFRLVTVPELLLRGPVSR